MIGDQVTSDGIDFEVVWDGGGLLPGRTTLKTGLWESPPSNRMYNKTGRYSKGNTVNKVIDVVNIDDTGNTGNTVDMEIINGNI